MRTNGQITACVTIGLANAIFTFYIQMMTKKDRKRERDAYEEDSQCILESCPIGDRLDVDRNL